MQNALEKTIKSDKIKKLLNIDHPDIVYQVDRLIKDPDLRQNVQIQKAAINHDPLLLKFINDPSDDIILSASRDNHESLKFIPQRRIDSLKHKKNKMVINNPKCLEYLEIYRPTSDVEEFILNNPRKYEPHPVNLIKYILCPSSNLVELAVKEDYDNLLYVHNVYIQQHKCILANEACISICGKNIENETYLQILLKYPWYWKKIKDTEENRKLAIETNPAVIMFMKDLTEDDIKKLVKYNPAALNFIDQSSDLIQIAINSSPDAILWINDEFKTESLWYQILDIFPIAIKHIKSTWSNDHQVSKMYEYALLRDGMCLRYAGVLKVVSNYKRLCLIAVGQNINALQYIKNKEIRFEMFRKFVSICPSCIQYIKNSDIFDFQGDDKIINSFRENALQKDGLCMEYIPSSQQTHQMHKIATMQNPLAIKFCHDPDDNIIKYVLEKNPQLLEHIHNQTISICKYAVSLDPTAVKWINYSIFEDIDTIGSNEV